jgi:hypothetical protein
MTARLGFARRTMLGSEREIKRGLDGHPESRASTAGGGAGRMRPGSHAFLPVCVVLACSSLFSFFSLSPLARSLALLSRSSAQRDALWLSRYIPPMEEKHSARSAAPLLCDH